MEFHNLRLTTLRSARGLFSLRVRRQVEEQETRYLEELVPVEAEGDQTELAAAWEHLATVREIEPSVLDAVRIVLVESVLDLDADRPELPALTIETPPAPYRPTAANPRAHRGTKDRPAKPKRPEISDLRPFLCSAAGQDRLLSMLAGKLGPVDWPREQRSQSAGFRRYFESHARKPKKRSAVTSAYHRLALDGNPDLRLGVAFMFAAVPENAAAWCDFLSLLEPNRQRPTLHLLWKTAAITIDPSEIHEPLVAANRMTTAEQFPQRLHYVLAQLIYDQYAVERALPCFEILDAYDPKAELELGSPPPTHEETATVRAFLERFKPAEDWRITGLLNSCSDSPHFAPILSALLESQFSAEHAFEFAGTLARTARDADPISGWLAVRESYAALMAAIGQLTAPYRTQGIDLIGQFMEIDAPYPFEVALKLLPLVCAPPFATESEFEVPLLELTVLEPDQFATILKAPIDSFLLLEKRSMRLNDARLNAGGLYGFTQEAPGFLVQSFQIAPGPLCRAARILGLLSWPLRRKLIRRALDSLLAEDSQVREALDAAGLVALVDQHAGEEARTFVPRKLRLHLQGEARLRPGQVDRHLEKLKAAWPAICCTAIRRLALERLSDGLIDAEETDLGELSDQMSHAIMLQARTFEHKRSLRRLIRACYDGDTKFLVEHPRNRAWAAAHPNLALSKWLHGIEFSRAIEPHGEIHLAVETDPLEALRLGTYVGSCLGLGGHFTWSAAATVLDINKQVVFARNSKGGFLARQIIGITDAGYLACFEVYPRVSPDMRRAFRDYNLALAKELDLEIFVVPERSTDSSDKVTSTLSQDWWDDSVWDHSIDE